MQSTHQENCLLILNSLLSDKYSDKIKYFLLPVKETIEDNEWQLYQSIIKSPRDINSILKNIQSNKYSSISSFSKDVELCFENAIKYNKTRYKHVYQAAVLLLKVIFYIIFISILDFFISNH